MQVWFLRDIWIQRLKTLRGVRVHCECAGHCQVQNLVFVILFLKHEKLYSSSSHIDTWKDFTWFSFLSINNQRPIVQRFCLCNAYLIFDMSMAPPELLQTTKHVYSKGPIFIHFPTIYFDFYILVHISCLKMHLCCY